MEAVEVNSFHGSCREASGSKIPQGAPAVRLSLNPGKELDYAGLFEADFIREFDAVIT